MTNTGSTEVEACRSCGSTELHTFLDLGSTPIANAILPLDADLASERRYPLAVAFCASCALVQLAHELPAEAIFTADYPYYSSFSDALCQHAKAHADALIRDRGLSERSFVVEVASNDGYLLKNYVAAGVRTLGIDPSPGPAAAAEQAGVRTLVDFFGTALGEKIRAESGPADVIIANNVMAHVPELNDFVGGFAALLADDGIVTIENPWVGELIEHVEFDTVYHEHFCYFSCLAVDALMRRHGLFLNHVEFFPALHGGTLRWHVGKREEPTAAVAHYLELERTRGLHTREYFASFGDRVRDASSKLRSTLAELRAAGKTIAAYGAAAKGSTLVNTVGIGADVLEYVVDRNVHKQNHLMPGIHVPIVDVTMLRDRPVDFLLLLAWNFKDEIMAQQAEYAAAGGRFILPLPEPVIA